MADSLAGERERHTLETLPATRLSDDSILLGKIFGSAGFGWGFALAVLLLNVAAISIGVSPSELHLLNPSVGLGAALLRLLTSLAASCAGVLFSLRSPTARQAQQVLAAASMLIFPLMLTAARAAPIDWRPAGPGCPHRAVTATMGAVLGPLLAVAYLLGRSRFRRRAFVID